MNQVFVGSVVESLTSDPVQGLFDAIQNPAKPLGFFVGAGVSIGSGLPSFFDFERGLVRPLVPASFAEGERDTDESVVLQMLRPEVLVQVLTQVYQDRVLYFYERLEGGFPNPNHAYLALALRAGHCVFTTNVDTLIEDACEQFGVTPRVLVDESDYERFVKCPEADPSGCLFKLHGSINHRAAGLERYRSIRFSLNQVGRGVFPPIRRVLADCLRTRDFVFMGYSANDHFSVQPVLVEEQTDRRTFWFKFQQSSERIVADISRVRRSAARGPRAVAGGEHSHDGTVGDGFRTRDLAKSWPISAACTRTRAPICGRR